MGVSNFSKATIAGFALALGLASVSEPALAQSPVLTPLPSNIEPSSCKTYFRNKDKIEKNDNTTIGGAVGGLGGALLRGALGDSNALEREAERQRRNAVNKQSQNASLRLQIGQQERACQDDRQALVTIGACSVLQKTGPLSNSEQRTRDRCEPLRYLLGAAATPSTSTEGTLSNCQNGTVGNKPVLVCSGQNGQTVIVELKP